MTYALPTSCEEAWGDHVSRAASQTRLDNLNLALTAYWTHLGAFENPSDQAVPQSNCRRISETPAFVKDPLVELVNSQETKDLESAPFPSNLW